jgi:hypothetical protein
LNEFCKNCAVRHVPSSIKEKFNDVYDKTFIECPTSDPTVVGCFMKDHLRINWNSFCIWLSDNGRLTTDEAMKMAKAGLVEIKDDKG